MWIGGLCVYIFVCERCVCIGVDLRLFRIVEFCENKEAKKFTLFWPFWIYVQARNLQEEKKAKSDAQMFCADLILCVFIVRFVRLVIADFLAYIHK